MNDRDTSKTTLSQPSIVNIAAYKFVSLNDLKKRRESLRLLCKELRIKGTILLSTEGINLFLAGTHTAVDQFLTTLTEDERLSDLEVKRSYTDYLPFNRMLVKVKKEIIAFGKEGIAPAVKTSKKLPPKELKKWLDEGKPFTLYDTRNDYEVKLGTFTNAVPAGVDHFREFPEAVAQLPEETKQQPVVMFCTGGIRCEKAGPFMEQAGFVEIYQLDGGILKYFEECGGEHYQGDCFVFDQRVAVDPQLQETDAVICFECLNPLTPEEQASPQYVAGESCPYCHKNPEEAKRHTIETRQQQLIEASNPLPGSVPYTNRRPIYVSNDDAGKPLLDMLDQKTPGISRDQWEDQISNGRLVGEYNRTVDPMEICTAGSGYHQIVPETVEPEVNADIRVIYEDTAILVINKSAPLPMHSCGRYNRNTVAYIIGQVYAPQRLRYAHRLDANTSGVVVFSRTRQFASRLQPQFEHGRVEKAYRARVHGHPTADEIVCVAKISDGTTGGAGIRSVDENGQEAKTIFRVLQRYEDGTSLLEARPITGRTNQIRIHAWHLGHAVVGDPMYLADGTQNASQTSAIDDPVMCLHAYQITFDHPVNGKRISFEAELPDWVV
ncbi:MAG: sulfurtransferase [Pirellulales bacterium]